jgi:phosphorylcholine metabolism protein LicD
VPSKLKEPLIYPGTERRDIYRDWNVSTEVPTPRKKRRNIEQITYRSQAKTKIANDKLLTADGNASKYKSPRILAKEFREEIRQEKADYLK